MIDQGSKQTKERFDKLITSLRTAVDNEGTLDKEATSDPDIFDAFRLSMKFYILDSHGKGKGQQQQANQQGHSSFVFLSKKRR